MTNLVVKTSGHDEWLTPKYITDDLGPFDLDPCSPGDRRPWDTANYHLTKEHDGLRAPWFGRVWCNPPYGKETPRWLEKLANHGNGIALVFARTDVAWFTDYVWRRANAVKFIQGRLSFCTVDGNVGKSNSGGPSCLIAYGISNVEKLNCSPINGHMVIVN